MIKIYTLILLAFLTVPVTASAGVSPSYSKGYIITWNDSIACYIQRMDSYNEGIKYKLNKTDKKPLKMKSREVQKLNVSYALYKRVKYKSQKSALMKEIYLGKISLYKHITIRHSPSMDASGNMYTTYGGTIENLYLVSNHKVIGVKKRKVSTTLKELMVYNKEIFEELEQYKPRKYQLERTLKAILSKYNYWYKYKRLSE